MSFNGAVDVGRVTDLGKYAANVLGINPHRFLNGLGT